MKRKSVLAILLVSTQLAMTGCGGTSATEIPLMSRTTKQQVLDYYADSLKYDAVITRASDEDKEKRKYEEHIVTDNETIEQLTSLYKQAESNLQNVEYIADGAVIEEELFNYIKGYLNDLQISGGKIAEDGITSAIGYYFVDVEYSTAPSTYGDFTSLASLIGIRGAFKENYMTGEVTKDDGFIAAALDAGNKYFLENNINNTLLYDDTNLFQVVDGRNGVENSGITETNNEITDSNTGEETTNTDVDVETGDETAEIDGNTDTEELVEENTEEKAAESVEETDENTEETEYTAEDTRIEDTAVNDIDNTTNIKYNEPVSSGNRAVKFDVNYINSIVGASSENMYTMPKLSTVYNIPSSSGISGAGVYPCGIGGMKLFGYNRDKSSGTLTLRYVFQESESGDGTIKCINIYPKEMRNEIPQFAADSNVIIPEYLMQEFEILVERADRAIVNCDLTTLISDSIFTDLGFGVLRGYKKDSTDILKHMSVIRQVISRSIDNNAYVLEIESTIIEGAKSSNVQGTYRDKSYIVIQQFGKEFKITDWVRVSRDVTDEPDIDAGNSTLKRLVALNLTGEVSSTTKKEVTNLIEDLYRASTYRKLSGPYEVETSDGVMTYERGMYDCFNNDVNLLRSDKKEELNSNIRGYLTAYGTNTKCVYDGVIDEWIGGYKNQVEFTTEEIMTYGDNEAGRYFRTYYLASKMNDVWYIDEMTVLDTEELDVSEISDIQSRISNNSITEDGTES